MTERIECVGGPLDGTKLTVPEVGAELRCSSNSKVMEQILDEDPEGIAETIDHIYRYDVTQSKYIYQGVEQ
ncbi:hypothetical protein [Gimesia maris]|uniref:hypothetical protein n=1 Tax=Gimesia maris TaxID=122 RepID=UPI0032ED09A2